MARGIGKIVNEITESSIKGRGKHPIDDAVIAGRDALVVDDGVVRKFNPDVDPQRAIDKAKGMLDSDNALIKEGERALGGSDISEQGGRGIKREKIKAFHGSPHDFDKFDFSHMGKGEGAQAYGHGGYIAEAEDVAKGYRDQLSKPTELQQAYRERGLIIFRGDKVPDELTSKIEALEKSGAPDKSGKLYEVEFDATPDELLDWDAPLSEQPEGVLRRLRESGAIEGDEIFTIEGSKNINDVTGMEAYDLLSAQHREYGIEGISASGGSEGASELLKMSGIKGIKYKDGMSREAGEGTNNYVVFDDRTLSIINKYGLGALGIGAGLAASPEEAQAQALPDDMIERYRLRQEARQQQEGATALSEYKQRQAEPQGVEGRREKANIKRAEGDRETTTAETVAIDIAHGVIETPLQVIGGVIDAVNETLDMTKEASDWLDANVLDLSIGDTSGPQPRLPSTSDADSATGGLVRGITQFITGFVGVGKMQPLKAIKPGTTSGRIAKATAQSALASFAALEPQEERLSDLIQAFPALENPVNEFLEYEEGDSKIEGRLKNALEDALIGIPLEGVAALHKGLKAMRKVRKARKELESNADTKGMLQAVKEDQDVQREAFKELLGEPDAPLLDIRAVDDAVELGDLPAPGELDKGFIKPISKRGTEAFEAKAFDRAEAVPPADDLPVSQPNKPLDPELDDLITAIAKSGGLSREEAAAQGIDPADFSKRVGIKYAFTKNGKSFDAMAEELSQYGYTARDANELLDKVDSALRGKSVMAPQGYDLIARREGFENAEQAAQIKAEELAKQPREMFVNWSRIDSEDDIKQIIQDAADSFKPEIDEARRGVQGWDQTKLDAEQLDAWDILETRRQGEPLNNAQTHAARELWVRSGKKLSEITDQVVANPSDANKIAFRKMLAVHNTIQTQVIAARTETARALNAWKIPAGDTPGFAGQMEQLKEMLANDTAVEEIAGRLKLLNDAGMSKEAEAMIYGSNWAKTADMVAQLWYFSLLSGPHTHMRNMISNTAVIGLEMTERKGASILGKVKGEQHVPDGEATAQMFGLMQGLKDAFRVSKKTERVGTFWKSVKSGESGYGIGKVELPRLGAFSSEKLSLDPASAFGRVADFVDTATTVPGRMLAAEDEIFKTINFRMEINAQAHRKASKELDEGLITKDEFKDRVVSITNNPDETMQIMGRASAQRNTFTDAPEKTKMYQAFYALGDAPIIGKVALPFRRTPYNIAKYTFERTPLAPFVKRWRDDIAAGGARGDLAWSKFLMGNAVLLASVDMAMSGHLTGEGSSDFAQRAQTRRQGVQPSSVRVSTGPGENDYRYFNYRGMEPVATPLGIAANMVEILEHTDWEDDNKEIDQMVIAATMAIAAQITSQQYMSGVSAFFEAMSDPQRYGESWWNRLAGAAVPTGVAQITRIQDPNVRYVNSAMDAIRARTPGLSKDLPARMNTWGQPLKRESGLGGFYDGVSPIYSKEYKPQPIDLELDRLEKYIGKPSKRTTIGGAAMNLDIFPAAYWRYVQLAGNEMTETVLGAPITAGGFVSSGKGLRDELNMIVKNTHPTYSRQLWDLLSDGPDGGKAQQIDAIVRAYREAAKEYIVEEFPDLKARVDEKAAARSQKFNLEKM